MNRQADVTKDLGIEKGTKIKVTPGTTFERHPKGDFCFRIEKDESGAWATSGPKGMIVFCKSQIPDGTEEFEVTGFPFTGYYAFVQPC